MITQLSTGGSNFVWWVNATERSAWWVAFSALPCRERTSYVPSHVAMFPRIKYEFSGKLVDIFLPISRRISVVVWSKETENFKWRYWKSLYEMKFYWKHLATPECTYGVLPKCTTALLGILVPRTDFERLFLDGFISFAIFFFSFLFSFKKYRQREKRSSV